jgi:hypothetical protein
MYCTLSASASFHHLSPPARSCLTRSIRGERAQDDWAYTTLPDGSIRRLLMAGIRANATLCKHEKSPILFGLLSDIPNPPFLFLCLSWCPTTLLSAPPPREPPNGLFSSGVVLPERALFLQRESERATQGQGKTFRNRLISKTQGKRGRGKGKDPSLSLSLQLS